MVHQKYMKGQFQFFFQNEFQLQDVQFDKKSFQGEKNFRE